MMRWEVDELLKLFRINLDPTCAAYRELGLEVLRSFVKALQAVERRQKGEATERTADPRAGALRGISNPRSAVPPRDADGVRADQRRRYLKVARRLGPRLT
jgi:hypothetical protein